MSDPATSPRRWRSLPFLFLTAVLTVGSLMVPQLASAAQCGPPDILSPRDGDGAVSCPVVFSWRAVEGITTYTFALYDSAERKIEAIEGFKGTTLTRYLVPDTYTFEVTPEGNCTPATGSARFRVVECCPLAPTLQTPGNLAEVPTPVSFRWTTEVSAEAYRVHILRGGVEVYNKTFAHPQNQIDNLTLEAAEYEWFVESLSSTCEGPKSSDTYRFKVYEPVVCPESAPVILGPVGVTVLSPVTFKWSSVQNATQYQFRLYNSSNSQIDGSVVTGTSLSRNLSPGVYLWKVEALAPGCAPKVSVVAQFKVDEPQLCPTSGPVLESPANETTMSSPVTFKWGSVPNAASYRLNVFKSNTPVVQQTTTTPSLTLGLDPAIYDWWVEALAPGCPAKQSLSFRFKVEEQATCPTIGAKLLTPATGSEIANPVMFTWNGVTGAKDYVLQIFDATGRIVLEQVVTGTSFQMELQTGKYKWLVQTRFASCPTLSSAIFDFSLIVPNATCPTLPPTLLAPALGASTPSPVTFKWSSVTGATQYRFILLLNDREIGNQVVTGTSLTLALEPAEYVWVVQAMKTGCETVTSLKSYFKVPSTGSNCPTFAPRLISPVGGADVASPVNLTWSAVSGAIAYRVFLFKDGSLVGEKEVGGTSLSVELDFGAYDWYVEAIGLNCQPIPSEKSFFFVSCSRGAPTLISPSGGASLASPVQFRWNGVSGANLYVIQIFLEGNVYIEEKFQGTSATFNLKPGSYRWNVIAFFADCPPETSNPSEFMVDAAVPCPNRGPSLRQPGNGTEVGSSPVSFSWDSIAGAVGYRLTVFNEQNGVKIVQDTRLTTHSFVLRPGEYQWFVMAFVERCDPVTSDVWRFKLPEASNCNDASPTLISPVQGAGVTPPVTFMWNGVPGALAYEIFLQLDGGAPTIVGKETGTSLTLRELRPGYYRWWVVAIFDRCPPTRSEVGEFMFPVDQDCLRRRPLLIAPANGDRGVPNPVTFAWTATKGAIDYQLFILGETGEPQALGSAVTATTTVQSLPTSEGGVVWFVRARFENCPTIDSEPSRFSLGDDQGGCGVIDPPRISVVGSTTSGGYYKVLWSAVPNADQFELQEADNETFRDATSTTTTSLSQAFTKTVSRPTPFYYRVRGIDDCDEVPGPFSRPIRVVIRPPESVDSSQFDLVRELGEDDPVVQLIEVKPGDDGGSSGLEISAGSSRRRGVIRPEIAFTAQTNSDWLTLSPSTGTLTTSGAEITATADPSALPPGTSTATVTVTTSSNQTTTLPVSVSLVTPVTPAPSGATTSESLIIPVVSHSSSGDTQTYSNVAVSNVSASSRRYRITFRETGTSDSEGSLQAEFQLDSGETTALDDVVASWFGGENESMTGVLEIRPLDTASSSTSTGGTVASSINFTAAFHGTLGEHVPAIPGSSLITSSSSSGLMIPNVSQSSNSTSSIGFVEGSGEEATVTVSFYDSSNTKIMEQTLNLDPGEHTELTDLLSGQSIDGGRAEVSVSSSTGSVLAYARVTDSRSGDTRFVAAQSAEVTTDTRIIAGAANLTGANGSRETNLWLYNPNSSPDTVTMTFYPEGDPASGETAQVTLQPGESQVIDSAIESLFGVTEKRGVIHVQSSSGVVTSATSEMDDGTGSISSLLPAISQAAAVSASDSPLQLLQLQESDDYSTDLGIAEVSGSPATVEVSAIVPGSLSAASVTMDLEANEFKQVSSVLRQLGLGNTQNARMSVRVVSGAGKVTSYASVIDKSSGDETVIPPN